MAPKAAVPISVIGTTKGASDADSFHHPDLSGANVRKPSLRTTPLVPPPKTPETPADFDGRAETENQTKSMY